MQQYKHQPFQHQLDFLAKHGLDEYHGLWWEQGTGKSKALIDNACLLWRAGKIDGVLILAIPGGERNWISDQLPEHLPDDVAQASRAMYWISSKAGQVGYGRDVAALHAHKGLAWLALTYPAFTTDAARREVARFLKQRRVLFICDEAMAEGGIKTPSGKRSKSAVLAGKLAAYRRIADGTPVAEGPFDFYAPAKFLLPEYWKGYGLHPFAAYRTHFGEFDHIPKRGDRPAFDKLKGYRRLDQLQEHLFRLGTRVLKADCLDLPPKVCLPPLRFDLTREQRRVYDQLANEYATTHVGDVTADLAIVRLTRFQQIVCGYMPASDEDATLTPIIPPADNPRLHAMEMLRDRKRGKTIVWCRYSQDVDYLMDMLGRTAVRYDGKVTDDECERAKLDFQKGDAEWFVATLSKGHTTITLHAAEHVAYYSNTFKLRHRLQSEDRAHRAGLRHSVDYTDLLANDTVDEGIVQAQRDKLDISATITGDKLKAML
jgi:SNF2 family DNA or RNA helicase